MSGDNADWQAHEGHEGAMPQPQRYGGPDPASTTPALNAPAGQPAPTPRPAPPAPAVQLPLSQRLAMSSGPIVLIVFFILGFAAHAWAWAWIVFLIPPALMAWTRVSHPEATSSDRRLKDGRGKC